MGEIDEELIQLRDEAETIISDLCKGRLHTNRELEGEALFRAERFLVNYVQLIDHMIAKQEDTSQKLFEWAETVRAKLALEDNYGWNDSI